LANSIDGPSAWRRGDLRTEDYRVTLSGAALDEIRRVADELREFPLPTILRRPEDFALPHCRAAMAEVRRILDKGVRFAIVDRLPLDEIGTEAATALYWLLASMVARPVAQSLDGKLVYDVRDTPGGPARFRRPPRPDQHRIEIPHRHSYNRTPLTRSCCSASSRRSMAGTAGLRVFTHSTTRSWRAIPSAWRASTSRSGSTASANSMRASRRSLPRRC